MDKLKSTKAKRGQKKTVGRDHAEIKRIMDGMEEKKNFAPMMQYSLSCLAQMASSKENIDSFVSQGGIEICMEALRTHADKPRILEEISKIFVAIAASEEYAEKLVEQGALEVVTGCLENHEATMGVFALDTLNALMISTENIKRFNASHGIDVSISAVESTYEGVGTRSMQLLERVAREGGEETIGVLVKKDLHSGILRAMEHNQADIEFCQPALQMLTRLARYDPDRIEHMRTLDAVPRTCAVMSEFPDDVELLDAGKQFLVLVSNADDLRRALQVLKRGDTGQPEWGVQLSIAMTIVSNLALVESNIPIIIEEGGVPILLAIIQDVSASAASPELKMAANAIRALGRAMINKDYIKRFVAEGGMASMLALCGKHARSEMVLDAVVFAVAACLSEETAMVSFHEGNGMAEMIKMIREHPNAANIVTKAAGILQVCCDQKDANCVFCANNGVYDAVLGAVKANLATHTPLPLTACTKLLTALARCDKVPNAPMFPCVELLLDVLRDGHPLRGDEALVMAILELLAALQATGDPMVGEFFAKNDVEALLADLMGAWPGHAGIIDLCNRILGQMDAKIDPDQGLGAGRGYGRFARGCTTSVRFVVDKAAMPAGSDARACVLLSVGPSAGDFTRTADGEAADSLQDGPRVHASQAVCLALDQWRSGLQLVVHSAPADAAAAAVSGLEAPNGAVLARCTAKALADGGAHTITLVVGGNAQGSDTCLQAEAYVDGELVMTASHDKATSKRDAGVDIPRLLAGLRPSANVIAPTGAIGVSTRRAPPPAVNVGAGVAGTVSQSAYFDLPLSTPMVVELAGAAGAVDAPLAALAAAPGAGATASLPRTLPFSAYLAGTDTGVAGTRAAQLFHDGDAAAAGPIEHALMRDALAPSFRNHTASVRAAAGLGDAGVAATPQTQQRYVVLMPGEGGDDPALTGVSASLWVRFPGGAPAAPSTLCEVAAYREGDGDPLPANDTSEGSEAFTRLGVRVDHAAQTAHIVCGGRAGGADGDALGAAFPLGDRLGDKRWHMVTLVATCRAAGDDGHALASSLDTHLFVDGAPCIQQRSAADGGEPARFVAFLRMLHAAGTSAAPALATVTYARGACAIKDATLWQRGLRRCEVEEVHRVQTYNIDDGSTARFSRDQLSAWLSPFSDYFSGNCDARLYFAAVTNDPYKDRPPRPLDMCNPFSQRGVIHEWAPAAGEGVGVRLTGGTSLFRTTLAMDRRGRVDGVLIDASGSGAGKATTAALNVCANGSMGHDKQGALIALGNGAEEIQLCVAGTSSVANESGAIRTCSDMRLASVTSDNACILGVHTARFNVLDGDKHQVEMIVYADVDPPLAGSTGGSSSVAVAVYVDGVLSEMARIYDHKRDRVMHDFNGFHQGMMGGDAATTSVAFMEGLQGDTRVANAGAWSGMLSSHETARMRHTGDLNGPETLLAMTSGNDFLNGDGLGLRHGGVSGNLASGWERACLVDVMGNQTSLFPMVEQVGLPEPEWYNGNMAQLLTQLGQAQLSDAECVMDVLRWLAQTCLEDEVTDDFIDEGGVGCLLRVQAQFAEHGAIVNMCNAVMGRLARDPNYRDEILACGGIARLVEMLRAHMDFPDILRPGTELLCALAAAPRAHTLLGLQGGVEVCVNIARKYLASDGELMVHTMRGLAMMCGVEEAFANKPNCMEMVSLGALPDVIAAMAKWGEDATGWSVAEHGAALLACICAGTDDEQLSTGLRIQITSKKGAAAVIASMTAFPRKKTLQRAGLRLLALLATPQVNRPVLIREKVVQAAVTVLKVSLAATPVVIEALQLITAVATGHRAGDVKMLMEGDSIKSLLSIPRSYVHNYPVLAVCYICLATLGLSGDIASAISREFGFIECVLDEVNNITEVYGDEEPVPLTGDTYPMLLAALKLVTVLAALESNRELLCRYDRALIDLAEVFSTDEEQMAEYPERIKRVNLAVIDFLEMVSRSLQPLLCQHIVEKGRAGDWCGDLLYAYLDGHVDFVIHVLRLLTNLSICEKTTSILAARLKSLLIQVYVVNSTPSLHNASLTPQQMERLGVQLYTLLANLALYPQACGDLIRGDYIAIAMSSMLSSRYRDHPAVVVRIFVLLITMILVQNRAKPILLELHAIPAVEGTMSYHSTHIEVQKRGDELLDLLYSRGRRVKISLDMCRDFRQWVEEMMPLRQRNLMQAGVLCNVYEPGKSAKKRKLYMSDDWLNLAWMNPKDSKKDMKHTKHKAIRHWKNIIPGGATPELRASKANPEHCITLNDSRGDGNHLGFDVLDKNIAHAWTAAFVCVTRLYAQFKTGLVPVDHRHEHIHAEGGPVTPKGTTTLGGAAPPLGKGRSTSSLGGKA